MAISLVQINSAGSASVATLPVTLTGITAGNLVIVGANGVGGSTGLTIVSGTDVYTDSPMGLKTTGMNVCSTFRIGAFFKPTAGATTYTVNFTGGTPNFCEIFAAEITGYPAGGGAWDQFAFGTSASSSTMTAGPTGTLSQAPEFVFGYMISGPGGTGTGQPSGWTIFSTANSNEVVYDTVAVTTAVTATAGNSPTSAFDAAVLTIKTAGAQIGKRPSITLLPPMQAPNRGDVASMVGWRGLRQLKAYPTSTSLTATLLGQSLLQVKNLSQSTGSVPILGTSTAKTKVLEQPSGKVPVQAFSEAQTKALEQSSFVAGITARSEAQTKSQEQTSGTLPIVVRSEAQTKALSGPRGSVNLTGLTEAQSKGISAILAAFLLTARTTFMSKTFLNPSLSVPIFARSESQVKSTDQPSGKVGIAALSEAQVKSIPAMVAAFFMNARSTLMSKALSGPSLSVPILARSVLQTKSTEQPSGSVNISSRAETMAKALAGLGTGGFAALLALAALMSKSSANTPNMSASLRGMVESQAKATSSPSGRVFLLGDVITQTKARSSIAFGNIVNLFANAVAGVQSMLSGASLSGGLVTGGKQWHMKEWEDRVLSMWMKKVRSFGKV